MRSNNRRCRHYLMSLSKSCIDLASYPENWDEISGSVRKRDGYKCCICRGEGVLLHVHHVRPRSEGGSDDPSNLVSVCVTCHAKAHGGRLGESKVDVSSRSGYLCLNCDRLFSLDYVRDQGLQCPVCDSELVPWLGDNQE